MQLDALRISLRDASVIETMLDAKQSTRLMEEEVVAKRVQHLERQAQRRRRAEAAREQQDMLEQSLNETQRSQVHNIFHIRVVLCLGGGLFMRE